MIADGAARYLADGSVADAATAERKARAIVAAAEIYLDARIALEERRSAAEVSGSAAGE